MKRQKMPYTKQLMCSQYGPCTKGIEKITKIEQNEQLRSDTGPCQWSLSVKVVRAGRHRMLAINVSIPSLTVVRRCPSILSHVRACAAFCGR